jgi:sulfur dioxygenase
MALRGRPDVAAVDLRKKSEREKHGVIPGSPYGP